MSEEIKRAANVGKEPPITTAQKLLSEAAECVQKADFLAALLPRLHGYEPVSIESYVPYSSGNDLLCREQIYSTQAAAEAAAKAGRESK